MGISAAEASLLALFLETLLYGVFLTLYLSTLFIVFMKTGTRRRFIIPVATVLLCVATSHVVISFIRALQAFVFSPGGVSANIYYGTSPASPLGLAQTALYVTQTTFADCVMVWRCFVLNHRSRLVAIPGCIALVTNGAIGCYVVWSLSKSPAGSAVPVATDICLTTFYTLTMVISVTCTSLIAWRIYRIPSVRQGGSSRLLPVFIAIIETGALYAMSVLALLVAFLSRSNGKFTALNIITPIVGVAFCLVILQVHFQMGDKNSSEWTGEPRGISGELFRVQDVQGMSSIARHSVLAATHATEATETGMETVPSNMMGSNKARSFSVGTFRV